MQERTDQAGGACTGGGARGPDQSSRLKMFSPMFSSKTVRLQYLHEAAGCDADFVEAAAAAAVEEAEYRRMPDDVQAITP